MNMVRVILPQHLRTLAKVGSEVEVQVEGEVTQCSVLDALEARYPMLRGTIRDQVTFQRRAFIRFFACEEDLSNEPPEAPVPPDEAQRLKNRQPPVGRPIARRAVVPSKELPRHLLRRDDPVSPHPRQNLPIPLRNLRPRPPHHSCS